MKKPVLSTHSHTQEQTRLPRPSTTAALPAWRAACMWAQYSTLCHLWGATRTVHLWGPMGRRGSRDASFHIHSHQELAADTFPLLPFCTVLLQQLAWLLPLPSRLAARGCCCFAFCLVLAGIAPCASHGRQPA